MNAEQERALLKTISERQYPCRQCNVSPYVTGERTVIEGGKIVVFTCHGEVHKVPWDIGDPMPRHPWAGPLDTDELPEALQGIL